MAGMDSLPVETDSTPEPVLPVTLLCANCNAPLNGRYCSACGQRHEPQIHSVGHFAAEGFESISHADSRLWRTLWYLLSRPGFLTREFFSGRRARYLPPFRLYLVISVVFFLVVGLPEGKVIRLDGDAGPERIAKLRATASELKQDTGPASDALKVAAAALEKQAQEESDALVPGAAKPAAEGSSDRNSILKLCDKFPSAEPGAFNPYTRFRSSCIRIIQDGGAELSRSVVHNIPRAMFVFLPLLALVMWLLYWRPQRHYVEHLLFLIHNHAFVFLVLAMKALLESIPWVGNHRALLETATWLYMIWYLYRAMRNYYGQGRMLTLAKYFTIGLAYISAGVVVLLLTALYSAMTLPNG
jgi:hypothetical protein